MQCPRCQTDDVYASSYGERNLMSLFTRFVRCHRCCTLYRVARWSSVAQKEPQVKIDQQQDLKKRKAA
jgi:hypothetical protein